MKTNLFWNFARLIKLINGSTLNFSYWMNSARSISSLELISGVKNISSSLGTIIDVGANKGQFAAASRLVFPNTAIICFEPHPLVFKKLENNVKDLTNILIFNTALGSEEKQLDFLMNDYDLASSFFKPSEIQILNFPNTINQKSIKVNVTRLDKLLINKIERPSLLKIDVQGFEFEVIKGSSGILSQIDYILLEMSLQPMYEGEPLFDEVNDFLRTMGFKIKTVLGMLHGKSGVALQMDAFYIHE